jgi:signal transduction histidine kinase
MGLRFPAGTVRVRATAAAVLVLGVVLLAGAFALLGVLREALTTQVKAAAQLKATEVAGQLTASGGIPPDLPSTEGELVQVLAADGGVEAGSPAIRNAAPLARLVSGTTAEIDVPSDDARYLAVAVPAETARGRMTVLTARTLDEVNEPSQTVIIALTVGLPVLLAIAGATTWLVVGRALAPVDAIRREVEEIGASQLHRRVPNPPGRDEIGRLARTMNRMLDRLETAAQRQRRFISDASHELRSPVAAIRQDAEVAIAHPEVTTARDLAETVLAENLRVQRLVEDLLLLANADEQTLVPARHPVDVDDLVFAEAQRLRDHTDLRIDVGAVSAGRVSGDQTRLARAVNNLASNAARHAASNIAFGLSQQNGTVTLTVADDGPGIPEADRERVFQRFVRLDAARTRGSDDTGGSGLGLAIVAEIIRAHGGTVTAGESPLGGAQFTITLPAG